MCAAAHSHVSVLTSLAQAAASISGSVARNGFPRIVIVGGVAGGASAATRARRLSESASITILERGGDVSFANCGLPYHIGGTISDRAQLLVQTPASLHARFNLDVRVRMEVVAINVSAKEVVARDLNTGVDSKFPYDSLLLSTGAEAIRPDIPGVQDSRIFTLRTLTDMDAILAQVIAPANGCALVVGAGFIGLEMAEQLRHRGVPVVLVELGSHVLSMVDAEMTYMLQDELRKKGVDLRLGCSVSSFELNAAGALVAVLGDGSRLTCRLAVLGIGVRPETHLARSAGLTLGSIGGIAVSDQMRTSQPDIYAVGDAVEVRDFVSGAPALIALAGPRTARVASQPK
jgi:NADPH-dependent 2,4-dienoyl-CoA reductase/sulfur reductase-like enzyme